VQSSGKQAWRMLQLRGMTINMRRLLLVCIMTTVNVDTYGWNSQAGGTDNSCR
jgi:hypothetical protein